MNAVPFCAGELVPPDLFRTVRLRTIFECCKWDPQVGDTSVLARYPILLQDAAWKELAGFSEELARETIEMESEILQRPELLKQLGLPRAIWKLLATGPPSRSGPRVMRFDFHFTPDGWRISEVNSDVPGGFVEAEGFTELMSAVSGRKPAGLPAAELAGALVRAAGVERPVIGLVHASAYSDDRQVPTFLARELEKLNATGVLIDPAQVRWADHGAEVETTWFQGALHALYRFYPAEWLPNLRRTCVWPRYFTGSTIPQCNPGWSLISQSKRFGTILTRLQTSAPAWQRLLPDTRDVREVNRRSRDWVFKPALGRVGEAIGLAGITSAKEWREIRRDMFLFPGIGWRKDALK